MAVYDKAYELARELKTSEEYKEYQKAKEAILGNESALSILKKFRKLQFQAQAALLNGKELNDDEKSELSRIQDIVNMHGPVKRFIQAEERLLIVIADIQKILRDAMELLDYT